MQAVFSDAIPLLHATSQALQPIHSVESVRNAVVGIQFSPKEPPQYRWGQLSL